MNVVPSVLLPERFALPVEASAPSVLSLITLRKASPESWPIKVLLPESLYGKLPLRRQMFLVSPSIAFYSYHIFNYIK